MKLYRLFFAALVTIVGLPALADSGLTDCPMLRIEPERLPDMVIPRCGHNIFYAGGELTVTGGHTTHFVPVATAEVFTDGKWRLLPMAYPHDNGFSVVLRSGEVLIGGGHSEELGVGQTYTLERYNPVSHTFEGFGCLDSRRVLANAVELDDRVIICGNHYAADAIASYDGSRQVQHVKAVRQGRSNPYILPIAGDDALILGSYDVYDRYPDTVWVDRVKGAAFRVPLFERWHPVYTDQPFNSKASFIGDVQKGNYSYLLRVIAPDGQSGFVLATNKPDAPMDSVPNNMPLSFSLLPTSCPVPMKGPFGDILYIGPVVVDRQRSRGYVVGVDSHCRRQYLLAVDYAKQPAALTLYYTDTLDAATITIPLVTPDGDLLLVGGSPDDNYKPLPTVWRYHFGTAEPASAIVSLAWLWWLMAAVAVSACFCLVLFLRRKRATASRDGQASAATASQPNIPSSDAPVTSPDLQLMERICELMDERQLFRNSNLKAADIAAELGTNTRYVTDSIKEFRGMTFMQFVNVYRVGYVQQILRQRPNLKVFEAYTEAGFTSERSFFRIFKDVTGMTTSEWLGRFGQTGE